jgi:hypothetical protein
MRLPFCMHVCAPSLFFVFCAVRVVSKERRQFVLLSPRQSLPWSLPLNIPYALLFCLMYATCTVYFIPLYRINPLKTEFLLNNI